VQIGCFYFPVDYGIDVRELARAMEDRGFESLFFPEHTHIPTSRQSPWPGGGELPKCYSHTHDPFVACTAAAVVTEKLKIGTGICLVPQHEPIVTAKAIASVDQISGGRVMFCLGGGWNVEEMEDHGATYKTRFAIMREHILAMKQLWTQDEASFDGEFVKFPPSWSWPKPVQNPHPPILLGGETDYTLKRVVEYCDGWYPRPWQGFDPAEAVARLKRFADEAGRDMSTLSITTFRAKADAQSLAEYADAGITRALLEIKDEGRDDILRRLDEYAKLLV
jgi:probable F420-dependent oxidoreductase